MKKFIFICLIMTQVLFSSGTKHTMLPYSKMHTLFNSVDSYAIKMGDGEKKVYVFLDPKCKFSRKFMKKVTENPYMLKKYKYHIFLYEIPRLKTNSLIHYIYQSKTPLKELRSIMLENNKPSIKEDFTSQTKATVTRVKEIATKLSVHKRPYIVVSEYENGEK